MADWLFDGTNKIIQEPTGTGDTTFSVARDLYSAWKRWAVNDVGNRFEAVFLQEGGTPIGSTGIFTGSTFVLINGWKLRAASYNHQITINGNIFSDDGVLSVDTVGSFSTNIIVNSTSSAQGIATGSGVTSQDVVDIKNAVFTEIMEDSETFAEQIRLIRAEAAGNLNPTPTSVAIRDAADTKDRIVATVNSSGQRIVTSTDGL